MRRLEPLVLVAVLLLGVASACDDRDNGLYWMNKMRADYGNGAALEWNTTLASAAQAWSRKLVVGKTCKKEYDLNDTTIAQNVHVRFATTTATASLRDACKAAALSWMGTASQYNFDTSRPYTDNRQNLQTTLDFVNMAWREASDVGCGSTRSSDFKCLVTVCNFNPKPRGNDDAYAQNIVAPDGQPGTGGGGGGGGIVTEGNGITVGEGIYYMKTSDKCLDVPGGITTAGVPLWVWSCSPGTNQQFDVSKAPDDGWYYVKDVLSGRCLTARGGGFDVGTGVTLDACRGHQFQMWSFNENTLVAKSYVLRPKHASFDLCLEVTSDAQFIGSWLQLNLCTAVRAGSGFTLASTR